MKLLITQAMQQRRLLRLIYNNRTRTVEPHILGMLDNGREAVLCWQETPPILGKDAWQVIELGQISSLRMLDSSLQLPEEGRTLPKTEFTSVYVALYPLAAPQTAPETPPERRFDSPQEDGVT